MELSSGRSTLERQVTGKEGSGWPRTLSLGPLVIAFVVVFAGHKLSLILTLASMLDGIPQHSCSPKAVTVWLQMEA